MIKYYTPGMEKLLAASIVLIFMYLVFRKLQEKHGEKRSEIKLVSVLPVGQKEKIIVCEVKDKKFIMGVTQHKINHLYTFDRDCEVKDDLSDRAHYEYPFVEPK